MTNNFHKFNKDIYFFSTSIFIKPNTLVIGDLHLGYADIVNKEGSMLSLNQTKKVIALIESILADLKKQKFSPKKIIILGDVKHDFGKLNLSEKRQLMKFFNFLSQNFEEIIITKGNHDNGLEFRLKLYKKIQLVEEYEEGDYVFYHGNKLSDSKKKNHFIGHEHPRISIIEKNKTEKFKCILAGKINRKQFFILPSFNPLLEGSDVMFSKSFLAPMLNRKNVDKMEVFVIHKGEVLPFGVMRDIRDSMDVNFM